MRTKESSERGQRLDALMIARLSVMKHRDEGVPLPPIGDLGSWEDVIELLDRIARE